MKVARAYRGTISELTFQDAGKMRKISIPSLKIIILKSYSFFFLNKIYFPAKGKSSLLPNLGTPVESRNNVHDNNWHFSNDQ